jgi:hypothetical protein
MSIVLRRYGPLILTFLLGMTALINSYVKIGQPYLGNAVKELSAAATIIATFMIWVGTFNLFYVESRDFMREKGTGIKRFFHLMVMGIIVLLSFIGFYYGQGSPEYNQWSYFITSRGEATAYSMLFFTALGACYRQCRIRSLESGLIGIFAFVIIFSITPTWKAFIPGLGDFGVKFILGVWNRSAQRSIFIGTSIAGIVVTLRTLLGKERGFLGLASEESA